MKKTLTTLGALALTTAAAHAGGIDRSGQSILAIFEKGDYAELSFGRVMPDVSGVATAPYGGFASGDMAADYNQIGMAVKTDLSKNLSFALILDQPFGADVNYPVLAVPPAVYYAAGSTATLTTTALTGVLKYTTESNVSVYGGLRYEEMNARASVPFVASYRVSSDTSGAAGYLVGVAYEKPEIALRVALTYNSKISHDFNTVESSLLTGGLDVASTTTVNSPQSVNLDFQTGVAKDTLVFGSIRWVDWSSFVIDPTNYPPASPLVSYDNDTVTYSLGIGRRFNENWAGAISVGYEGKSGGFASNLGPTDGKKSITIGATYTKDNLKISGGVSYVMIGDAQTTLNGTTASGQFTDNSALGVGFRIGYSF